MVCRGVQISGGHKYLPPKQDVNAPDLYIPTMSVGTYCLLLCLAAAGRAKFKPEVMTAAVRVLCAAPAPPECPLHAHHDSEGVLAMAQAGAESGRISVTFVAFY